MVIPFGIWAEVGPRNQVSDGDPDFHTWNGNFEGTKGLGKEIPGHVQWSICSERLRKELQQFGADAGWGDGVHIGATWRIWLNRPCAASVQPCVNLFVNLTFPF